jgi:hypothetical protein
MLQHIQRYDTTNANGVAVCRTTAMSAVPLLHTMAIISMQYAVLFSLDVSNPVVKRNTSSIG